MNAPAGAVMPDRGRRLVELANALTSSSDVAEIMTQIAATALGVARADGAYVERFSLAAAGAEVVATIGARAPPLGSQSAYPGALAQLANGSDPVDPGSGPTWYAIRAAPDAGPSAILPLAADGVPVGTLVLFRTDPDGEFQARELTRATMLGQVAALVLRKNMLAEQVQRVIDDKFRLFSGVAYNLKDSLASAAQYVDMLGAIADGDERAWAARSRRGIDTAVRLIGELLDLIRAETGRLPISLEPANVGALLRDMANDHRLAAGTTGLRLEIEVPATTPIVQTDMDCVRQILDALLSNAVRYTPSDGVIRVAAERRTGRRAGDPEEWLCLSVADDGPGLADAERIFEEMHRIEQAHGQLGFRLAISRRIARLLGGELTLQTAPGAGCTFTLWLPLAPAPAPPAA